MENNLTSKPIPALIRQLAIPSSIGFFFNTMFNVVDTYYAGLLSTSAIAALSISFPIFFIIIALGSGISTGATALIAHALGENDTKKARFYSLQAISFSFLLSLLLTGIGIYAAPSLFTLLGAEGTYLSMALSYINVIFIGAAFFMLSNALNASLSAQGDTKSFMNVLIAGFILNLIFDPWFMFGGFGLPALGIAGTAIATVVIQALGTFYMMYRVSRSSLYCRGCWKLAIPKKEPYIDIAKQGFPAGLNMMTVAIGIFVITYFISKFGQAGVAAYGIATRIEQIFLLPTIGLNISTLTLVGQNAGAKKFGRVREAYTSSMKYGLYLMIAATLILLMFRRSLMAFFTSDPDVIGIGAHYLIFASFMTFAYVILFTSVSALQGLKKPLYALIIGLTRQIVAPLLVFSFLTSLIGLTGIWWGILVIVWASAIFTFFYTRWTMSKIMHI